MTNEMLKIALDDEDTASLLHKAAMRLANALVPSSAAPQLHDLQMVSLACDSVLKPTSVLLVLQLVLSEMLSMER